MVNRDKILLGLPAAAAAVLVIWLWFFWWQIGQFEQSCIADAGERIAVETGIAAKLVYPQLLEQGGMSAAEFERIFEKTGVRASLIDSAGQVLADNSAEREHLGNHATRPEILQALSSGKPATSRRFSTTSGEWLIYYAQPLTVNGQNYVLRLSLPLVRAMKMIDLAKINMFWALLLGAELVLVLTFYMYNRVRQPLTALLDSAKKIADGELDTPLPIPKKGVVRELALGIAAMTNQLKSELAQVQTERNEKAAILDHMNEAVLVFDPDGNLLRANPAARVIFAELATQSDFNLSRCAIPKLWELSCRLWRTGEAFEEELNYEQAGQSPRVLFCRGAVLLEDGRRDLLLAITDLSNQRKLESFRSDFIANVSHEIKTPVTCIVGAAEALQDDLPPDKIKQLSGMLLGQSKRLNDLVQDILSLAALERRQLELAHEFAVCDLGAVAANAVNLCRRLAQEQKVDLTYTSDPELLVDGDTQFLEQAISNLLVNALKYSNSAKIDVSAVKSGKMAVIRVRDYGVGIAPEHQGRIFERFYRVHKERSRELGGTGLGLAIVKHIAQLHGGKAELVSEVGKGCEFRLILPLAIK